MTHAPFWTTSSYGEAADTTPLELAALHQHMRQCSRASGPFVAMQCGALRLRGFVLTRLVTTLALAAAVLGGLILLF